MDSSDIMVFQSMGLAGNDPDTRSASTAGVRGVYEVELSRLMMAFHCWSEIPLSQLRIAALSVFGASKKFG